MQLADLVTFNAVTSACEKGQQWSKVGLLGLLGLLGLGTLGPRDTGVAYAWLKSLGWSLELKSSNLFRDFSQGKFDV